MAEPFDVGDEIRTTATVYNDVGQLADPDQIQCIAAAPDNRRINLAVGRVSQGVYEGFLVLDEAKIWAFRWAAVGGVTTAEEITVVVRKSRVI